ncbi:MAG: ATP-binding cassette domain-containing protein [Pirellulaceae bacterium]
MAIVTIKELTIGFRGPLLLNSVSCQIEPGQRIGLLGRNGAGKTTFMRILRGDVEPDGGEVQLAPRTRVALLPQDVPQDIRGSIWDVVEGGLCSWVAGNGEEEEADWKRHQRVTQILTRMNLDGAVSFETLSAGMKRRVLLAQSLVSSPELLLLDEPTNHMDIAAITWLEDFLTRWDGTLVFVTHDRMFLRHVATRILEIDRGKLFDWSCDYDTFLKRKEAFLVAEEKQNALFDKRLAQEEAWIRQGVEARRTRNEGRVRALIQMRRQRTDRRSAPSKVNMRIDEGARSGQLVADVKHITFAYGDREIVRNFSTTVMRGDKVGLMGPNGAGKTTLLRLILGQLPPQHGHVRLGTNLQIAYFDQLREQLVDDLSVQDNVSDGSEAIRIGSKSQHVIGYLQDFLFSPERARTPVRFLSGGERNRVLLAKLFAKPANLIVLDEPTNDLDAETVELLEDRLVEYPGTVLLISHDREFVNNVVTSTIVFEASGVKEYVGGYDDWLRQRPSPPPVEKAEPDRGTSPSRSSRPAAATSPGKRRLTHKEQQELAALPRRIEQLETELTDLHAAMAQPDFYKRPGEQIAAEQARLKNLDAQLTTAYERWEELESDS